MNTNLSRAELEIAVAAARWVVDEGLEYVAAKKRAARDAGWRGALPPNEVVEEQVREHIALFCAESQATELLAMREEALYWMQRLAAFRPHLMGAVWRGTATRLSSVRLDMYCDDPKALEMSLIDLRIPYDVHTLDAGSAQARDVYTLSRRNAALQDHITTHLIVNDLDELRGALKADAGGRSWRGDLSALQALMRPEAGA